MFELQVSNDRNLRCEYNYFINAIRKKKTMPEVMYNTRLRKLTIAYFKIETKSYFRKRESAVKNQGEQN